MLRNRQVSGSMVGSSFADLLHRWTGDALYCAQCHRLETLVIDEVGLGLFYRHCRNRRAVLPAVRAALTCSTIEDLTRQDEYAGAIWAFVEIDDEELDRTPERINVSLPRFVLRKLDRFAEKRHETRSGLLARAAMALMAHG